MEEQSNLITSPINGFLITLAVLAIYSWILFVPGYLFITVLGLRRHQFLLSYGISLFVLVIYLTIVLLIQIPPALVVWMYFVLTVGILIVLILTQSIRNNFSIFHNPTLYFGRLRLTSVASVPLAITFGYVLYHSLAGPYTEIPSDYWKHVARTVHLFLLLGEGEIEETPGVGIFQENDVPYWYLTHAIVARLLGIHPLAAVNGIMLLTSLIFILSTYFFTIRVCEPLKFTDRQKIIAGAVASLLVLVTFGTATFSYVRYYAYSPAIVAFPLVYLATMYMLDYLERSTAKWYCILIIPFVVIVAGVIHLQEALFCILLIVGVITIRSIRLASTRLAIRSNRTKMYSDLEYRSYRLGAILFVAILVVAFAIFGTTEINSWRSSPHTIDAGKIINILSGHPISNPSFRFWDTMGLFGAFVYLWYLFRQKWLRQIDYLTAAMAIPLFTFFNPIYSNLFLRINEASVLWRPAYLIPFSVVAGILFVLTDQYSTNKSLGWRLARLSPFIVLSMGTVLPFDSTPFVNRTSRIPSLMSVDTHSGGGHLGDLIGQVDKLRQTQEIRRILSDQITSFVLYAAINGQIFFPNSEINYFKHNREYKDDLDYSDHTRSLLIINRRNGYRTLSTRISRHWPDNVLNTSERYPSDIDEYVANNSDISLLWSDDSIFVYLMPNWDPNHELEE